MVTRILIAEDNTSAYMCYHKIFSNDKTIEIIGRTVDGESTIEMYKEKNPDLLILDLNLPKKNGLEVLEELAIYEGTNPKCNVLVISGEVDMMLQLLNTRKVLMITSKPVNEEHILNAIKNYKKEQIFNSFSEKKCNELLLQLNLNPYSKNGRLLTEAIKLCYFDYNYLDNMNYLYSTLGCRNSCSPQKIKSSLRSIVDTANRSTKIETMKSIFFTEIDFIEDNKNISPKHFINGMVVCLKK